MEEDKREQETQSLVGSFGTTNLTGDPPRDNTMAIQLENSTNEFWGAYRSGLVPTQGYSREFISILNSMAKTNFDDLFS